jgi:biopolymer transport protein ExbB
LNPDSAPAAAAGLSDFIGHADVVGLALFTVLGVMSLWTWTVILRHLRAAWKKGRADRAFGSVWPGTEEGRADLAAAQSAVGAQGRLVARGLQSVASLGGAQAIAQHSMAERLELIGRDLEQAVETELGRQESGLTSLAAVASTAPFVGLFGTVWGIYNALIRIGQTGQSSLDQVAGPVGEALIMTALGLAVAIPAALAHTVFSRQLRHASQELQRLAHELTMHLAGSRQRGEG